MVNMSIINDEQKEQKKKSKINKPIIIVVILIIFALIPTSVTVPYQRAEKYQESYTVNEAFNVEVPYTDIEYYMEKEPFTNTTNKQKPLVYNIENTVCSNRVPGLFNSGRPAQVTYIVNNLDTEGGTFKFWVGFSVPDGNKIGKEISNYMQPQKSAEFTYTADALISGCYYNSVTIPTKTITDTFIDYRDVQKSRSITIYRTETQHKDVVKTRPAIRYVPDYNQQNVSMYQKILGWY